MFAEQVESFVLELADMTQKDLITWERFPQHYPFQNNLFVQNFIQKHPEMDKNRSYFFSHKNGLVLFIRYTSGKIAEGVHIQKHFGEPIIDLTQGYAMDPSVPDLGKAIDRAIAVDESLPAGVYHFMGDIEKLNISPDAEG